jgi:2'-5' RNA ligase
MRARRGSSGAAWKRPGSSHWRRTPTARLGIESEKRAFAPHLTLARIKERIDMGPLRRAIEALPTTDFGQFQAESFYLYQSTLRPTGSIYTKLETFPL